MHLKWNKTAVAAVVLLGLSATALLAVQRGYGRRGGYRDPGYRAGVPMWEYDQNFSHDAFTFARVIYRSDRSRLWGRGGGGWATDHPDSDLNFSLRLQQLTSMKVNPVPEQLEFTNPRIFDFPFLYMVEVGAMALSPDEILAMRKYCLNGGFIMIDDFWGDSAWLNLIDQLRMAFPDRQPSEVPLEHEIFHCVYDMKEKPQIPSIHNYGWRSGRTWEDNHDGDTRTPHYQAIYDDEGRIMVFICHNTDLGDGWEREGEDREYFQEFAVKKSYPMGINIVTYAMTH
jgi:hypothetical protein